MMTHWLTGTTLIPPHYGHISHTFFTKIVQKDIATHLLCNQMQNNYLM